MFGIFKKKKPRTMLDDLHSATAEMFRPLLKSNKNLSDEKIAEIVQTVMRAFKEAADSKGLVIPGTALVDISSYFITVFDQKGNEFFIEHLKYEINVYLTKGLREAWGGDGSANPESSQLEYNMARDYYGKENYKEAIKWYMKSAEKGNDAAQSDLGVMYFSGQGVPQNYSESAKWFRKAAEQGNAESQSNLGVMYSKGLYVTQNDNEAIKWFKKAAEQGFDDSQYYLGMMYMEEGVAQNFNEAARWLRKAAEQGHADAQKLLGVMYIRGDGVVQNLDEAVKWLRKAAEQGHVGALEVLKRLADKLTNK